MTNPDNGRTLRDGVEPHALIELKPCPFCGGNAVSLSPMYVMGIDSDEPDLFSVGCVKCQIWHRRSTKAAAESAWNARARLALTPAGTDTEGERLNANVIAAADRVARKMGARFVATPPREPVAGDDVELRPFGYAPGHYMLICPACENMVSGVDKRAVRCRECAEKAFRLATITTTPAPPTAAGKSCDDPHCHAAGIPWHSHDGAAPETKGEVIVEQGDRVNQNMIAPTNVNLWSDEIERLLEAGFATVSRNPSDHETCVAYRTAIWLAMTATRPQSVDVGACRLEKWAAVLGASDYDGEGYMVIPRELRQAATAIRTLQAEVERLTEQRDAAIRRKVAAMDDRDTEEARATAAEAEVAELQAEVGRLGQALSIEHNAHKATMTSWRKDLARQMAVIDAAEAQVRELREALTLAANRMDVQVVDAIARGDPKRFEYSEWAEEARRKALSPKEPSDDRS